MGELSFLVCAPSEPAGDAIRQCLESSAHARVEGVISDHARLAEETKARRVEALFVALGEDPEATLSVMEHLPAPRPLILMSGPQDESAILLRAMRLGVKEFFPLEPEPSHVCATIERLLLESPAPVERELRPAPVLTVLGAKGGIGATTVACQLAAALQPHGAAVIVDLDLAAGDVALYLDVTPPYTLSDLNTENEQIDATYVHMLLHSHPSGVRILASPDRLEEAELTNIENLERLIAILREEFEWVVLDLSRSFTESTLRVLDLSDQVLLVTSFDVPALHHTRRQIELFRRLGCCGRVRLIANRGGSGDAVTEKDFTRFLSRVPDATLPNDFSAATSSICKGSGVAEVARNGPLDRSYRDLALRVHRWCDRPVPADPSAKGWLGRSLGWLKRRTPWRFSTG